MNTNSIKIYTSVATLPTSWDEVAVENAFLQKSYLDVLENSAPTNMQCFYIGIFEENQLIGVALAQYLNLNKLESFGERDKCLKTYIRNFVFKNFIETQRSFFELSSLSSGTFDPGFNF